MKCAVRHAVALAALTLVAVAASPAAAQEVVEPTQAQIQLYQKAIEAYQQEDWARAIELLRSSLALGELNLVYLNLGRALFRSGDCAGATEAYNKALTAPAVAEPPAAELRTKVETYRKELASCPGTVVLSCEPRDMKVTVDGAAPVPCAGELMLSPGEHVLTATNGTVSAQTRVVVETQRRQEVELMASGSVEPPPVVAQRGSPLVTWGLITASAGGATLIAAAVVDQTALATAIEEYEYAITNSSEVDEIAARNDADGLQTTVLILTAAGGAVTLSGVVILAIGLLSGDEAAPPAQAVAPWIVPGGGGGVSWSASW